MRNYDKNVLHEVQKNILMAREAIGEVNDKECNCNEYDA